MIRSCYQCAHFDGYRCRSGLKKCWKFNLMIHNRSCSTEHYYYTDRITGKFRLERDTRHYQWCPPFLESRCGGKLGPWERLGKVEFSVVHPPEVESVWEAEVFSWSCLERPRWDAGTVWGIILIHGKPMSFWRDVIAGKTVWLSKAITFAFFLSLGRALYRYTRLSCKVCEEGMVQVFHDLLKETFCCSHDNLCNNGNINLDTTLKFGVGVDNMTDLITHK